MSESTDTRLFDAGERPSPKALFVRDLPDGETVETILLVKESAVAQRRSGEDYLRLKLCDCTGTLEAIAWDGVAEVREIAQPGIALRVRGRYEVSQRYGPQIVLKSASLAQAGDYRLADLMDAPAASAEQMEADLRRLIGTVRNPWLGKLLDALIGDGSPVWSVSGALRPRSTTTRPTCTGCSSTRCPWAKPSARCRAPSRESTATWLSPAG